MKQFDSRNIDKRAGKLLNYHIELLTNQDLKFTPEGESYYEYQRGKEDYLKIGYHKRKKLLSRTFNLEFKSVIHEIELPESFDLKLQFKGFPKITGAAFTGSKNSRKFECYFQDKQLISAVLKEAGKVEIAYVHIQYNKVSKKIEVSVCPYAGAYLWVIFPPAFYDMRLKEEEIRAVYYLVEAVTDYINRKLH